MNYVRDPYLSASLRGSLPCPFPLAAAAPAALPAKDGRRVSPTWCFFSGKQRSTSTANLGDERSLTEVYGPYGVDQNSGPFWAP